MRDLAGLGVLVVASFTLWFLRDLARVSRTTSGDWLRLGEGPLASTATIEVLGIAAMATTTFLGLSLIVFVVKSAVSSGFSATARSVGRGVLTSRSTTRMLVIVWLTLGLVGVAATILLGRVGPEVVQRSSWSWFLLPLVHDSAGIAAGVAIVWPWLLPRVRGASASVVKLWRAWVDSTP